MAPKQARNIDGIVAVQCQQCWKRAVQCQQYCHDCWDAWGHYVVSDPPAEAGARMPPSAEAGPKKKAKMQAAKLKSLQPKGAQDADPPAEVASGSGGQYGIEVKGSGERPLAEAAALETDPEKLAESETHPKLGEIYAWRGKTYRKKVGNGVNASHAIEDIHEYVSQWPPHRCSPKRDVTHEVPYQSTDDFVNTCRQSGSGEDAAFLWPSGRIGFMRAIAVAIHHLPVGHMVSIKNARKIPAKFYDKDGFLKWELMDLYHGTSAHSVPNIMGKGFCPPLGAGCDALFSQFGVPVPGVYVAKSWKVATTYPMESTTGPIPQCSTGVSGGSYIALDGTKPLRAIIRVLGDSSQQLWSKGSNQSLYKPSDLQITHVCFYAVHPKLVHTAHLGLELHSYSLDGGTPVPEVDETSSFLPESPTLTKRVAQYLKPIDMGTHELCRAQPPMRALIASGRPEEGGGSQLAEAAAATAADSSSSSGRLLGDADGRIKLRILFEQWLSHQSSQARIGSYGSLAEVSRCSTTLQSVVGKLNPSDLESASKLRIAVEINYSFLKTDEQETRELQGERSTSLAEALRRGTRPEDAKPLARKVPGDTTDVLYSRDGGRIPCGKVKAQGQFREFPPRTAESAPEPKQTANQAKRHRQREARSADETSDIVINKKKNIAST